MKKIFFLICLLPIFVFAKEYTINDINLKLDVNDNWIVFTRDNLDNNDDLITFNLDKESLLSLYQKQMIYFDGIPEDTSYEFLVIVPNNSLEVNNLSHYPDGLVMETSKELAKKVNTDNYKTYMARHKYAVVNYFDKATNMYIVNYYTVMNAKGYNFQLQKQTKITNEEIKNLENIIDSIEIKELIGFEKENETIQKEINNYGKSSFNFKNVLIYALIGAITGGVSALVSKLIKKKSSN